ncbi:MAG: trypsin-like peptidase domain-containing protein [Planctomycetes bacterium]|nr:trypsin-like peptidase domain-containing protein [Planctomycetota bacterium]
MLRTSLTLILWAGLVAPIAAEPTRESVARGKAATAFVHFGSAEGSATAFCIDAESGIFVTNQHVVKKLPNNGRLQLVVDPSSDRPRELLARVLRTDVEADLAILKAVDHAEGLTALELGDDTALFETMSATTFGFPFGKQLAAKTEKFPEVSVSIGRVTALRRKQGKLDRIQLDATLNPGNSGGPVIDENGKLIGVVNAGIFATGVNFAIPTSKLEALLAKPIVSFTPPAIKAEEQSATTSFEASIVSLAKTAEQYVVELELRGGGATGAKVRHSTGGGK